MEVEELENPNDEYEERVMVLSLDGVLDSDSVKKAISHGEINFRELDGEKPIVQIGASIYSGEWTQTIGTDMIFCANRREQEDTGTYEPRLDFLSISDTRLVAKKVILVPASEQEQEQASNGTEFVQNVQLAEDELATNAQLLKEVEQLATETQERIEIESEHER